MQPFETTPASPINRMARSVASRPSQWMPCWRGRLHTHPAGSRLSKKLILDFRSLYIFLLTMQPAGSGSAWRRPL